jgi:hypothetical protein
MSGLVKLFLARCPEADDNGRSTYTEKTPPTRPGRMKARKKEEDACCTRGYYSILNRFFEISVSNFPSFKEEANVAIGCGACPRELPVAY